LTPLLIEAVKALRIEQETRLTRHCREKDAEITRLTKRVSDLEHLIDQLASTVSYPHLAMCCHRDGQ
jgi:hypothetical protein